MHILVYDTHTLHTLSQEETCLMQSRVPAWQPVNITSGTSRSRLPLSKNSCLWGRSNLWVSVCRSLVFCGSLCTSCLVQLTWAIYRESSIYPNNISGDMSSLIKVNAQAHSRPSACRANSHSELWVVKSVPNVISTLHMRALQNKPKTSWELWLTLQSHRRAVCDMSTCVIPGLSFKYGTMVLLMQSAIAVIVWRV